MIRKSSPFVVPKAPEILYRNELYSLINGMIKDYKTLLKIYKDKREQVAMDSKDTWLTTEIREKLEKLGSKWGKKFDEYAQSHSKKFVLKLMKMSNTQIKMVLKDWFADKRLELVGEVIPNEIKQVVNASIEYNVSLISSIAPQYHERILGSIMRSISGVGSIKQLTNEIYRYGNMSMRRAKLIANDQTRKIYGSITLHNCQRLGIRKMQWLHSGGGKYPRDLHLRKFNGDYSKYPYVNGLNGLIFDIDNPPVIQLQKGKLPEVRGYPTELVGCKCMMRAVFE